MTRPWTLARVRAFSFSMAITLLACLLIAPLAHAEWYEGGSLHRADGHAWVKATEANRLATAGDFAATSIGEKRVVKLRTMDRLRPYAADMKACVDETFAGSQGRQLRGMKVSEVAAVCYLLLEADWNATLPR
jgi:hypothetical protein